MDLELEGKVAVVTGGASGLGLETARYLAREGVALLLADVDGEALKVAAEEVSSMGTATRGFELDVGDYDLCRAMVTDAEKGLGPVDILVNSAGIGGDLNFFSDTDPADWRELLAINLGGVMNCCRAVTDGMIERRYGKIISMASEAGRANEKRMVVYGTTKGGVISLTRGLAAELGRYSINVNAVCPGITRTPMTAYVNDEIEAEFARSYPLGRLGRPGDIAPLVTFLASDRASWITGQAISVNGGFGRH
jgi:3-oxoacyl-[acyl-carrier protein] reductase